MPLGTVTNPTGGRKDKGHSSLTDIVVCERRNAPFLNMYANVEWKKQILKDKPAKIILEL